MVKIFPIANSGRYQQKLLRSKENCLKGELDAIKNRRVQRQLNNWQTTGYSSNFLSFLIRWGILYKR